MPIKLQWNRYKHSISELNLINAGLKEFENILFGSNDTILAVASTENI